MKGHISVLILFFLCNSCSSERNPESPATSLDWGTGELIYESNRN